MLPEHPQHPRDARKPAQDLRHGNAAVVIRLIVIIGPSPSTIWQPSAKSDKLDSGLASRQQPDIEPSQID